MAAFNNQAVLDKNTGLVWEQAPDATLPGGNWLAAKNVCVNKNVGGTVGWRLPSVVELKSLQDPTLPKPFVPTNVFTGVQGTFYWSATTLAVGDDTQFAWGVFFDGIGDAFAHGKTDDIGLLAWCVRGGMNDTDRY